MRIENEANLESEKSSLHINFSRFITSLRICVVSVDLVFLKPDQ